MLATCQAAPHAAEPQHRRTGAQKHVRLTFPEMSHLHARGVFHALSIWPNLLVSGAHQRDCLVEMAYQNDSKGGHTNKGMEAGPWMTRGLVMAD